MKHSPLIEQYQKIVDSIGESLDFFERVSGGRAPHEVTAVDFFASHEGLLMHYEQAQTRYIERQKRWYNLSTHMPWIGMRTAALDGAHVEFFRGIANPMGVKIGPAMTAEWLQGLVTTLNPNNTPGRLTIIHRFGAKDVEKGLPKMIQAVRETGQQVLWICDPMHGNTETSTRRPQDAALREHPQGTGTVVPDSRGERLVPRRRAHRAHGRRRHRMHRRSAWPHRRGPCACIQVHRRSAPQLRAGAGTGDVDRQARPGTLIAVLAFNENQSGMQYEHIKVPKDGKRITINPDASLNVPDNPISPSSRATVSASTSPR